MLRTLLVLAFLSAALSPARLTAGEPARPASQFDPQLAWQAALLRFRAAGDLIGQEKYEQADQYLDQAGKELPPPYGKRAAAARESLRAVFSNPEPDPFGPPTPLPQGYAARHQGAARAEQLSQVARVCEQLECFGPAADLYMQALKVNPASEFAVARRAAANLRRLAGYGLKGAELKQLIADRQLRSAVDDELELRGDGAFHGLEQLHESLTKSADKANRLSLYKEICRCLAWIGDGASLAAWEAKGREEFGADALARGETYLAADRSARTDGDDLAAGALEERMLTELAGDRGLQAKFYDYRASDAQSDDRFDLAWRNYEILLNKYPEYSKKAYTLDSAGNTLQKLGRYAEAIEIYQQIMALGDAAVIEVEWEFGKSRYDRRSSAADGLSACYEAVGDYPKALEYAELAYLKFPNPGTTCGLGFAGWHRDNRFRIAKLTMLAGKAEDGVRRVEELLKDGVDDGPAVGLFVDHFRRGRKLDKVGQRLDELAQENLARATKEFPAGNGGVTDSMTLARDYSALAIMADRHDVDGLWQRLEQLSHEDEDSQPYSAYRFDSEHYAYSDDWLLSRCVELIRSLGDDANPFLLTQIHKPSRMQGWALVLLARLKAPQVLEKVRGELAALRQVAAEDWDDSKDDLTCDYYYALALLNSRSARELLNAPQDHQHLQAAADVVKDWLAAPPEDD